MCACQEGGREGGRDEGREGGRAYRVIATGIEVVGSHLDVSELVALGGENGHLRGDGTGGLGVVTEGGKEEGREGGRENKFMHYVFSPLSPSLPPSLVPSFPREKHVPCDHAHDDAGFQAGLDSALGLFDAGREEGGREGGRA